MTDYHNPISIVIPHDFQGQHDYPTEVVAQRFQAYRDIIKDLVSYLRQYASVQEEIVRQQVRLHQAVGAASHSITRVTSQGDKHSQHKGKEKFIDDDLSALNQFFLPIGNGSIQDIPTILTKFHQQNIQTSTKTLKDISNIVIPKLEDLRKDLLVKIKEIKNLQNDFKNTLSREINETRNIINQFNTSIDAAMHLELLGSATSIHHDSGSDLDVVKKDPYLVKLKLDRQLKKQLSEESYLYEAFKNLQTSSEKLESIVVLEIQNYMGMFLNLVETESSSVSEFLVPNFKNGFLAKEPGLEWEAFVERNLPKSSSLSNQLASGMFIDLSFPSRKISDLSVPHYDSLVNVAVREGTLERRSKFLKSYSSGYYVLTCSYLHEFKTADRKKDQTPVMSLSLDHCSVSEHSKNDGKLSGAYKFVLYSKSSSGLMNRGHNWSFRCDTYGKMIEWFNDIKTLTSLPSPSSRAKAMSKKLMEKNAEKRLSRTSSVFSGEHARSIRSNLGSPRPQSKSSTKPTSHSVRSAAISERSATSTGQNQRLSSTFSQKFRDSPKLTNLINSDGTEVTPVGTQHLETGMVDKNGDIIIKGESEPRINGEAPAETTQASHTFSNGGEGSIQTPQQIIPQNYQYYINQVHQQPQQFYDPVSQQFFTINAIPASQVAPGSIPQGLGIEQAAPNKSQATPSHTISSSSAAPGQPMPQYFPSSPLPFSSQQPIPGSYSAQFQPSSPTSSQGQYLPRQSLDGGSSQTNQHNPYIPQFPSHFNEGAGSNAPYPSQFGDGIMSQVPGNGKTEQTPATETKAATLAATGANAATLADNDSRHTITDE